MGRKSAITQLDPDLKQECDRLIREGVFTIDQLVEHLKGLGAEVSRSSVGRYKQRMESQLKHFKQVQEISKVWVGQIGAAPDSQMGQLLAEILKSVIFRTLAEMGDDEAEPASPADLMFAAKALKEVAGAQKTDHEFRLKLRAEWEAEQRKKTEAAQVEVEKVAKAAGMTPDGVARIKDILLGITQ
jgi:hypothetical protein